jgi:hypothetical protein
MPELDLEKLQLFLVFIVPGFVALKVYDLLVPAEKRDPGASLIEIITYSLVNLVLMSWAIYLVSREGFAQTHRTCYFISVIGIAFFTPAILAVIVYKARVSKWVGRWILHPMPTAWDFYFGKRQQCWVLFHLKNGKMAGGFFGENSYASSFPHEPDLYVEQVWRIDEQGRFKEKIKETEGMIIKYDDCDMFEFFSAGEEK